MTDALTLTGWTLAAIAVAAVAVYCVRRLLIWAFNRISDHIEHHISTAIARPLYGDHKTLDQELIELVTKEHNNE